MTLAKPFTICDSMNICKTLANQQANEGTAMSMVEKKYLKTKPLAEVKFSLPSSIQGETVHLVGDFNEWNETATPMKKQKDGSFAVTLKLDTGREYQFRYLVNGTEWHNDWNADKYLPNPFSGDNSVVVL
jgi:1,4-alpha-glucan branching enzyme